MWMSVGNFFPCLFSKTSVCFVQSPRLTLTLFNANEAIFVHFCTNSSSFFKQTISKSLGWAGGGRGWGWLWMTLCIKLIYSEPTWALNREVSSGRRELSDVVLAMWYPIFIGWRGFRVFLLESEGHRQIFWFSTESDIAWSCIITGSKGRQGLKKSDRIFYRVNADSCV